MRCCQLGQFVDPEDGQTGDLQTATSFVHILDKAGHLNTGHFRSHIGYLFGECPCAKYQ
jgi:hypothetical protein